MNNFRDLLQCLVLFGLGLFCAVIAIMLIFYPESILGGKLNCSNQKKWSRDRMIGIVGSLPLALFIFWMLFFS